MNTIPSLIGLKFYSAPEKFTGLPSVIKLPATIRLGQTVKLIGRTVTPKCKVVVVKPAVVTFQTPGGDFLTYQIESVPMNARELGLRSLVA